MKLRVDLQPKHAYPDTTVLIDTIPSCTVAPIVLGNGLTSLTLCSSARSCKVLAKKAQAEGQEPILMGESKGIPLEGYNYGISAFDLLHVPFTGQVGIMYARSLPETLGKMGIGQRSHNGPVLLGSLYNAHAAAQAALKTAQHEIALVCCGLASSEDTDDTVSAGVIASFIRKAYQNGAKCAAEGKPKELDYHGAALMSMSLLRGYATLLEALWHSRSGSYLRSLGIQQDIAVASRLSHSKVVPILAEVVEVERGQAYRFVAMPHHTGL